jgi:NADH-quinone oxidoreductase subunit M
LIATAIVIVPLAAAALCLISRTARWSAVLASIAVAAFGGWSLVSPGGATRLVWAAPLGAAYAVDVDALSSVFVCVLGIVSLVGAAASARVADRRAYFALWCVALASLGAVLVSRDLALLFVAWETTLIVLAILVRQWGGGDRRVATHMFLAYTLVGSGLFLVALASIAVARGTLDMDALATRPIASAGQLLPALLFLAAFAPALPLFPLHGWAPRVYAAAPPPVAALIAAGLGSAAAYGVIRCCLALFPQGIASAAPALVALSALGVLYGAVVASKQDDVRRVVAYVALSQQNVVALAAFVATLTSLRGAVIASLSDALVVTALLVVAGWLARHSSSFLITRAWGIASSAPTFAGVGTATVLAAVSVPGTAGFAGMVLALAGSYESYPEAVVVVVLAELALAAAGARLLRRVVHGPPPTAGVDVRWRDWILVVPLLALILAIGAAPGVVLDRFGDGALPATEIRP